METRGTVRRPPTGRRKITVQELQTEVAFAAADGTHPSLRRIRSALRAGAHALGLPETVVRLALYLLSLTREGDWQDQGRGHGMPPIAWPSDDEIRFRFDIRRSRCTELKRALVDFGLARMRRSPNGKRYGKRCKQTGRILDAYGFDLSVLSERVDEFEQAAAELKARRAEGKRLRAEITCLRNQVLALVDLVVEQAGPDGAEADAWHTTVAQAEALWAERGDDWDPKALVPIAARLKLLMLQARERAVAAVDIPRPAVERSPMGPLYRPHHIDTQLTCISKEITKDGSQMRSTAQRADQHHDSHQSREYSNGSLPAWHSASRNPAPALRGFPATPEFVLQIAPIFRNHVCRRSPDWSDLVQAAFEVRASLGISQHCWGSACEALGRVEATVALAAIAAKHSQGKVTSPGGYLRGFVKAHKEGRLQLDRTLFGLAERGKFLGLHRSSPAIEASLRGSHLG